MSSYFNILTLNNWPVCSTCNFSLYYQYIILETGNKNAEVHQKEDFTLDIT